MFSYCFLILSAWSATEYNEQNNLLLTQHKGNLIASLGIHHLSPTPLFSYDRQWCLDKELMDF